MVRVQVEGSAEIGQPVRVAGFEKDCAIVVADSDSVR
jgi:hypothetical protein